MLDRHKVSYHMKDLLKRDVIAVKEVASYLDEKLNTKRNADRRVRPKRMMARLIAANMVLNAAENVQVAKELMDRTEGKVADKLQVEVRRVEYHVSLPSSDQPSLDSYIDGHIADTRLLEMQTESESSGCKIDQQSSVNQKSTNENQRPCGGNDFQEGWGGEDQVP